jgi:hypothetical protein
MVSAARRLVLKQPWPLLLDSGVAGIAKKRVVSRKYQRALCCVIG